ncbi:unnamed protein product [Paramecium sonneborni]|uniref:Uncharacterized protein n=1 Tax=Paramecium sonneborni TaxID=65129 RepID=A0A8S1RY88_9CILI|nr:unnamed protein product [Paramecium sonneborni]
MNLITKEPNFYHNLENNDLIIDFQKQWAFIQQICYLSLFKFYICNNQSFQQPFKQRIRSQEYIEQLSQKGNVNIQKFNLLLNLYQLGSADQQLIDKIKQKLRVADQFKSQTVKQAKIVNDLQNMFDNKQRKILLKFNHQNYQNSIKNN